MKMYYHQLRAGAICAGVLAAVCLLIAYVLPWCSSSGLAGEVIQYSYEHDRDATPLFYTESDRTWEIMRQIEQPEEKNNP